MNPLWGTYRMVAPVVGALAPAAGVFTSPAERVLWLERLGHVTRPGACDAWVHAASLGEAVAALPFVRELQRAHLGSRLQLTSTTRSGRERLRAAGHDAVLAPLDTPQAVRRFHRGVHPGRLFLIETELWPHWLLEARRERVPVAVVSARLSERSVHRYQRLGGELRALVAGLGAVLCQGDDDRQRWLALGATPERTSVVGNLKSDGLPEAVPDRAAARRALGVDPLRPLLVLGSVRPGEPRLLARAWRTLPQGLRTAWQVVAVPRHPRALAQLQSEAIAAGLTSLAGASSSDTWRWDERLGVLTQWYQAADVAFVGGSLAPYGGHNPMEAAACGAAVIMGVHDFSQRGSVRALDRAGALWRVPDSTALARAFEALLGHADLRATRSEAGVRVAAAERGSAARAVTELGEAWTMAAVLSGPLGRALASVTATAWEARRRLYEWGVLRPERTGTRVVSVGNLTVGGAGKTTLVLHLARMLREAGVNTAVVTRRYRPGPEGLADEELMYREAVGPERTFAGTNKRELARQAAAAGAAVVLVDDGFSHWGLERDLDIVLLDRTDLWGGSRLLPAGRLREPLVALQRADVVVITRLGPAEDAEPWMTEARRRAPSAWVAAARHEPAGVRTLGGAPVSPTGPARVLTATGNPGAVERSAREAGFEPVSLAAYRDHHWFSRAEAEREHRAAGDGTLLLSSKDAVRWPPGAPRERVAVLGTRWRWLAGGDEAERRVRGESP